jgi:peptidylprolyl isomerase
VVVKPQPHRLIPLFAVPVLLLTGCGGSSSAGSGTPTTDTSAQAATVAAATAPVRRTAAGVFVTGDLGDKPALTIPSGAPPAAQSTEVLVTGTGATVAAGQTLVVNYLGQTWDAPGGEPNIFDNTYDRAQVFGFQLGAGAVIEGWDTGLVGKKIGSRMILTIPPAQAYGEPSAENTSELAGHTLVFVIDIVDVVGKDNVADGKPAGALPEGWPEVDSRSGKKPVIRSVSGVKEVTETTSRLLLSGTGEVIDEKKTLVLEWLQTDLATGKQTQQTWGNAPEIVPASDVLGVADVLKGQRIGSRAIALLPDSGSGAMIVILDVVGQY